ncbi:MAG: nitrogenase [Lachnospiraceae bacterium]|nr:nitrogenase [Lachnospiraceae bacterium]
MLRSVRELKESKEQSVLMKDAHFPVPFRPGLEFNAPVHGTWNIVHIGMNVPEAIQIYVCGINCMRGVVLTAAEMNCQDRFSLVILEEKDLLEGRVEEITIEGVSDVLNRLEKKPPAVLLFTVCTHHFLGCDLKHVYQELGRRFPDILFVKCYMDPIMQKHGLTPDQKLRYAMGNMLLPEPVKPDTVSVLGCDFPLDETADIRMLLRKNHVEMKEIFDCKTLKEYRRMGSAETFICTYPPGRHGIIQAAKRLDRSFYYLPSCFGYEEIAEQWETICGEICRKKAALPAGELSEEIDRENDREKAALSAEELEAEIRQQILACEAALKDALDLIGETPIVIDGTVHPRPLGLAKLLLEHGFSVKRVHLDAVSKEEQAEFDWLKENAPELLLTPTIQPEGRVWQRGSEGKVLAIGQKAAWFSATPYFVNMVQGGGLWGFDGIRRMAALMKEAFLEKKDTEDLVPRKGLGCESCV